MHWHFFPCGTDPSKRSSICSEAPWSEREAAELLSEALLTALAIYLLMGSESHSTHILPFCSYAAATCSPLLPNQALSRVYQHPLNKTSITLDVTTFPLIANSTFCSPNPPNLRDRGTIGSTVPVWPSQIAHAGSKLVSPHSQKGWNESRTTL